MVKTSTPQRTPIAVRKKKIRLAKLKMTAAVADRKAYVERLGELQVQMLKIQQAYHHSKRRAILVFEGWDAGGKGGTIRRMTERLDPRGVKVWPIGAPDPREQGRHYLYRFWSKLPEPGGLAIFDRSWYGRVLVERVEGFCPPEAWQRAYAEINEFERLLYDDGVRILKFFFHITPEEQLKRFTERITNPAKRWKITEEDIRNRERWDDYAQAVEDVFDRTNTGFAPWHAIAANRKWYVRTQALEIATRVLSEGVDVTAPAIDPHVMASAESALGLKIEQTFNVTRVDRDEGSEQGAPAPA